MSIRSFAQARKVLAKYAPVNVEASYTLDRMRELMDFLGNPQDKLKVVHIAGTSGKTSTSYYMTAFLQAAEQKVGLTVSPHIDEINERVQINLVPLNEAKFCSELEAFLKLIEPDKRGVTYFEIFVAFAYWEFVRQKVDYAVVEVGLGGLLDGTNVISSKNKVCVITDIGLDHINVLGDTLTKIAGQKAGIIQPHNHVFSFRQNDEVMDVIQGVVEEKQAHLHVVPSLPLESAEPVADLPMFQRHNWELARAVYDYLVERDQLPKLDEAELANTTQTYIPARMEIIQYKDKTIVLDGAHNAQKMRALATSLHARFPGTTVATLLAMVNSPSLKVRTDLAPLQSLTNRLYITTFGELKDDYVKQAADPEMLAQRCRDLGFKNVDVLPDPIGAFKTLLKAPEPVLLVTGSFYLMNHIRPLLLKEHALKTE